MTGLPEWSACRGTRGLVRPAARRGVRRRGVGGLAVRSIRALLSLARTRVPRRGTRHERPRSAARRLRRRPRRRHAEDGDVDGRRRQLHDLVRSRRQLSSDRRIDGLCDRRTHHRCSARRRATRRWTSSSRSPRAANDRRLPRQPGRAAAFRRSPSSPTPTAQAISGAPLDDAADAARLLPAGFSLQTAQADAVAIAGSSDATSLDRGLINDRAQAIALGQFDPATGQFAQGFGPQAGAGAGRGRRRRAARPVRRRAAGGGRGGGRRRARRVSSSAAAAPAARVPYQGTATYTFGGSALNTPPYQLNPDVPATQPQFAQNTFGTTFGGPLKIPGLYKDTNRRTNFQLNYTGNRSDNAFDQYATVPTAGHASRRFLRQRRSSWSTRQPASRSRAIRFRPAMMNPAVAIPARLHSASRTCRAISSTTTRRRSRTRRPTASACGSRRTCRRRVPAERARMRRRARRRIRRRAADSADAAARAAAARTSSCRDSCSTGATENEALNVFPGPGKHEHEHEPHRAAVAEHRAQPHDQQLQRQHRAFAERRRRNAFANVQNVGGLAGINYPTAASTDPQNWGVPRLSFTGFTGVFGAPATSRTDTRITTSYFWLHPYAKHQLRIGGDYRLDRSTGELNTNAPGAFTFTGLYSSGGIPVSDADRQQRGVRRLPARPSAAGGAAGRRRDRAARPVVRRVRRRQLAEELEAHVQPRPSLRAGGAVHGGERPAGQPRRRAGLHSRGARVRRAAPDRSRVRSRRA